MFSKDRATSAASIRYGDISWSLVSSSGSAVNKNGKPFLPKASLPIISFSIG